MGTKRTGTNVPQMRGDKNMLKLKTNKKSGITLISLVVTIIVLLLLAGISIMMLTGNNGILQRASDAKEETIIGQEKESVELAYITAAMKKLGSDVTANELQDELDAMLGDTEETDETKKKTNVKQDSNNTINVLFRETQHNYNVNQGKVAKALEDGIYVGNVRLGGLYLPDVNNMSYEDYRSSHSNEEEAISIFAQKCYSKIATNSEYKDAIESAEKVGISREWIDYEYNNQGDRIRNIQAASYYIELRSPNGPCWNTYIPLTADITSADKNFDFDLNLDIQYEVRIETDTEDPRVVYSEVTMNPEAISFCYNDPNQAIPDEVQLPLGMVLKKDETLIQARYDDAIRWGYTEQEAIDVAILEACVIEWQGQTFNCEELREYILNNTKIVYNGQTVNLTVSTSSTSATSGEEIDDLFGIDVEDLRINGYLDGPSY